MKGSPTLLEMLPIVDDVAAIFTVTTTLSHVAVLSNRPTRVVVG
jgi:hypothetical protein